MRVTVTTTSDAPRPSVSRSSAGDGPVTPARSNLSISMPEAGYHHIASSADHPVAHEEG